MRSECVGPNAISVTAPVLFWSTDTKITRMHSSRMHTARSLTVSPCLIISHACPPPQSNHTCPPSNNAGPPPEQPCMPPRATTHIPRATMYALQSNHACTPPRATTHAPREQPHMPPKQPRMPPQSNHACPPKQPCMPPPQNNHARLDPVNRMTNWCKNITLPQTSFAGGKYDLLFVIYSPIDRDQHLCQILGLVPSFIPCMKPVCSR